MYAILIKLGLRTIYQIVTPLMSHLSLLKFWEVIWDDSLSLLLGGEGLGPSLREITRPEEGSVNSEQQTNTNRFLSRCASLLSFDMLWHGCTRI